MCHPTYRSVVAVAVVAVLLSACNEASLAPPPAAQPSGIDAATGPRLATTVAQVPVTMLFGYSLPPGSTVLTFEDLTDLGAEYHTMSAHNPYYGVTFSESLWHWSATWYGASHSGAVRLFPWYGVPGASVSFATPVWFHGLWAAEPHSNGSQLIMKGYNGATLVGTTTSAALPSGPAQWIEATFPGKVTRVEFFTQVTVNCPSCGDWYVIDDIQFGANPLGTADATPPIVTPTITGTLGDNGWYTTDVTVTWTATDPDSPISSPPCAATTFTTNTTGTTVTCSATSDGGTATASVTIKRDDSAPDISSNLSGTLGADGWYTSDANVSWTTTDPTSGIASSTGCSATSVTADVASVTFTCSATNAAGLSASKSVTLKRDASAPDVSPTITGTLGANGWYTSDIGVGWATADATSGIASSTGCDASSVTSDIASITFTCSATNGAGLSAQQTVTLKRDAGAPDVAFAGNAIAYTVDQAIAISCSTTDAMSGVATSNCATASGAAYTFDLGAHTLTASATDYAGNDASASTTFTVSVTYGSLCALTRQFVAHAGIANSMCVKLDNAYRSEFRGSAGAAQNQVQAFINEVRAQSGKALTAAQAGILTTLAGAF